MPNALFGRPSNNPDGRPSDQPVDYRIARCPECNARVGAVCRRPNGERAFRPHAARRDKAMAYRNRAPAWTGRRAEMLPVPAVVIEYDSMAPPTDDLLKTAARRTAEREWPKRRMAVREAVDFPPLTDYATGEPCAKVFRVVFTDERES